MMLTALAVAPDGRFDQALAAVTDTGLLVDGLPYRRLPTAIAAIAAFTTSTKRARWNGVGSLLVTTLAGATTTVHGTVIFTSADGDQPTSINDDDMVFLALLRGGIADALATMASLL